MEDIVIVGKRAVKEAIVSGHTINKIQIQEGIRRQQINDILGNAKTQKLIIQTVPKSKLDNSANAPHQGVVILITSYEYADFNQLIQSQEGKESLSTIAILDGLEDPHNPGSIIRTTDVSGVSGVVILKGRPVVLTQTAAKVSTGAIQHVPVIRVINLSKIIDELKDNGYWVVGAEADNAIDYHNMVTDMPLAIVIGSEGQGMSRSVKDKCDFYIKTPMVDRVSSLGASITASLVMCKIYRKRHQIEDIQ